VNTWIRLNQAGYTPDREKTAIVLAEQDITNAEWSIKKDGKTVISGKLSSPSKGDNIHIAQKYYYSIDFTALREFGEYTLELSGAESQKIIISENPYSRFAEQAIGHLRLMRSGCPTPLTNAAHLGDAAAIVYEIDGNPENGAWKETGRTVDMVGGHYDAGDFIKFTLTEANMVWHLLRAYEENPALSNFGLLDEGYFGLNYLAKTLPDPNTFIIQVGDKNDHRQGRRLPENDKLDGKRPAFCALSRAHMGMTAAALALGARVLKNETYKNKAEAIYARAKEPDTIPSAFERDTTNDFYHDPTDCDNMALAAVELYRLTQNENYLADAKAYAPPAAARVTWSDMHGPANHRIAQQNDPNAKARLLQEISAYDCQNPWGLPGGKYSWGSLPLWIGMANLILLAKRLDNEQKIPSAFLNVLDYIFGRNNWGISMLATPDLPHTVKNMYNWLYQVMGKLAVGALSEGPGNKERHDGLSQYFTVPKDSPLEQFNTSAAVFYDNGDDFMIQESTIWGQGSFILMLSLL